jgi:Predicted nucleotidyltransferase.
MSIVSQLFEHGLISYNFPITTEYETILGSHAYGLATETSDIDIFSFCIPPIELIFPSSFGKIHGFSTAIPTFTGYYPSHIMYQNKSHDLTIYNIVHYFRLLLESNPNILDSLFSSQDCILNQTKIGKMVRDNRSLFVTKLCKKTYLGYAYKQKHKLQAKWNPDSLSKRRILIEKYGYDVKYAYNLVRLVNEARQILQSGQIDLHYRKKDLQDIRTGAWSKHEVLNWFADQEKELHQLCKSCDLPEMPDEVKITQLLFDCLEEYFGDISKLCIRKGSYDNFRQYSNLDNQERI